MSPTSDIRGIRFEDVAFSYAPAQEGPAALDGVDLGVMPGELVAVVGANGSGKSTLGLLANGLLRPGRGMVTVDGMATSEPEYAWDIRTRVGLVFQNPDNQIVNTLVEEDVAFGPENLGLPRDEIRSRVDAALETVGLTGMELREPSQLSGGQKQRLAIAGVLALDPAYLVLDEPTAMLDPQGREDVLAVIARLRAAGHGIVHITHHLADVVDADRAVVLAAGRVAYDDEPAALVQDAEALARMGLSLPPLFALAAELRSRGVAVPMTSTATGIVQSLWR